jgi:HK97 family phage major capsid protein
VFSTFTAATEPAENSAITDGPYPVLAQQSWGTTPTFAASYTPSFQLVQDAPELEEIIQASLSESIGRVIAPVAQTALYSTINAVGAGDGDKGGFLNLTATDPINFASGTTAALAANTISLDTAARMIGLLNEAYLPTAAWYMNKTQWTGLLRQVSTTDKKAQVEPSTGRMSLYNIPVVLTSQATAAAASTVSGPVLGDLGAAMTLRIAGDFFYLLKSSELRAEFAEWYYRAAVRADVQARDARAVVGVKYFTS